MSCIPKFQKLQNTQPHKILRDRVIYLIKSKLIVFNPIQDGGGVCAFHFAEIFHLVEITSLLHVIVMLEEKIIEND